MRLNKKIKGLLCLALALCIFGAPTVLAQDGIRDNAAEAEVAKIYIETAGSIGSTLEKSTGYVPASISVVFGSESEADTISDTEAQIKVRGNTTALGGKKPYNIKFSSKKNLFEMGSAKTWVLLANFFDPTLLRNYIAFDLAERIGIEYTSEQKIVELWLDGEYKGVYTLMEKVEARSSRVDINVDNGDFLIEIDDENRREPDVNYVYSSQNLYAVKDPEYPVGSQQANEVNANIKAVLDEAEAALKSGDYRRVRQALDTQSFAKMFVLEEEMSNYDTVLSYFFYYKDGKLHAGPPWDFDLSSGNVNPAFSNYYPDGDEYGATELRHTEHWFKLLLKYGNFADEVLKEYEASRQSLANIYADGGVIDSFTAGYKSAIERNFTQTPYSVKDYYFKENSRKPSDSYEENVEILKTFFEQRQDWLDAELSSALKAYEQFPFEQYLLLGDINLDGELNAADVTALQKRLVGITAANAVNADVCDVNRDGAVNIKDATAIQKIIVAGE